MSSETEKQYAKDLPEDIMAQIRFRYGAVTLDGFKITDVRLKTLTHDGFESDFGIFLKLEKKS